MENLVQEDLLPEQCTVQRKSMVVLCLYTQDIGQMMEQFGFSDYVKLKYLEKVMATIQ